MATTSQAVNRSLRKHVAPVLREAGFERVDARNAWMWRDKAICVFHTHAVGYTFSQVTGWPPGSLSVELGIYYTFVPTGMVIKLDAQQRLLPAEYHCHMRLPLERELNQKNRLKTLYNPAERRRKDLWWTETDGSNADAVASDIAHSLAMHGLPWFSCFLDIRNVLKVVEHEHNCFHKYIRAAFLAREIGDESRWLKYASLAEHEAERIGVAFNRETGSRT